MILILSILLAGISIYIPNTTAVTVDHNVGNVDINMLTDFGRLYLPITWGTYQTTNDPLTGFGFIGLVIDQDNYNHAPMSEDIADSFSSFPYTSPDDFTKVDDITMIVDDGITQKSTASFKNTGAGTLDPDDILINQTAWTVVNKDWAILQWNLKNLDNITPLTGVCIGLELPLSQVGAGFGVGGDSGDDIDGYDSLNDIYWASDDGGTTIGFASATVSNPITHHYSQDYHPTTYDEYKVYWENDTWLYDRIRAPNAVVGAIPGNRTSTVGWNDITINGGSTETFTLVIAVSDTYGNMESTLNDAQNYYHDMMSGFRITEFSDSSSATQQIEVFNYELKDTDLAAEGYFLSLDGVNPLSGTWNKNPLPNNEYALFTLTAGTMGPEGDTIGMYQDLGGGNIVLIDGPWSYGQEGVVPDPLNGESVARRYDVVSARYTSDWLRSSSSGPTWGVQNDVTTINPTPKVILNEVMFYPSIADGGYVTIINKDPFLSINVRDYYIVCDTVYQLSGFGDIWLDPFNTLIIRYSDNAPLFDNMDSQGDNIYLYDNSGQLLDMVGWNTPHLHGMSACRLPQGRGTYKGYNDTSSEAAGWLFNNPVQVLISEISDSGSTTAQIEVYNPRYPSIDFNVGFTFESSSSGVLAGTWSPSTVDIDEYAVFHVTTPDGLDTEGDTISLFQNGLPIEEFSYGQQGTVPDPLSDESVERVFDSGYYTDVWVRNYTTGPNFGAQNDVPPANFNSPLILNEILFYPDASADCFVELHLKYGNLDLSGYKIVGDSEYIIPQGTELTSDDEFFYLTQSGEPAFFTSLNPSGDNVYLYDDEGSLLDMAGWSSSHMQGTTMCRVPMGDGGRDGFDDTSSIAAGWVFNCKPSIQLVKLSTTEPVKYGTFDDIIFFNLTLFNKQSIDDTILIFNSSLNGYPVLILDETETYILTEILIPAGSNINITVMVILPSTIPFIDRDNITITIQSENTTTYWDSIKLQVIIIPFIWPEKYISPPEIYLSGSGHDEISTITLNLTGMGSVIEFIRAQEVIFCVDTSGSMTSQAITLIKDGLIGYVNEMRTKDMGAVVIFNDAAWLLNPLTDDHTQIKDDIASIPNPDGATYMGEALKTAIDELLLNGNTSHVQVIILLTDGIWNGNIDPLGQANRAAANNITIFTIGLEPSWPWNLDEATLIEIADRTKGQYYYAENADQIPEIYQVIAAYIGDIAGRDTDITDAKPMVRDVLPPWIELVDDSFSIDPAVNYVNETGYRILEWNLSSIQIFENWEVSFQIKSARIGLVQTNDVNTSRVYYLDYFDNEIIRLFPECVANVLPPRPLPPKLYIEVLSNKDDVLLYWDEPLTPGTHHYLIYRAKSPNDFDFSSPWVDTNNTLANGIDPVDGQIIPLRSSWNHTGAVDSSDGNYSQQWYYCIRTVNSLGEMSHTSRTVGKWTIDYPSGTSTFSLPLEPLETQTTTADFYLNDMKARYVKWMDPTTHFWMQHGDGEVNDAQIEVGKGYEVNFSASTEYTFIGMPGAMIKYFTSSFTCFNNDTDAESLAATVNSQTDDVTLTWTQPRGPGLTEYDVYYSTNRDGFHGTAGVDYILLTTTSVGNEMAIHSGAALPGTQYYYIVIPVNSTGFEGSSTYSIGVWTASYSAGYDTLGLPLILSSTQTVDWYCDQIDKVEGINYYIVSEQRWGWHSTIMHEGAYDPTMDIVVGYQVSTTATTKYTFIGI